MRVQTQINTTNILSSVSKKKHSYPFNTFFFRFLYSRCFDNQKVFEPFWSSSDEFEEILISSLMWADHMRDFVLKVIKNTVERFKSGETSDRNYSPACRQHHHGLQRCLSDNESCYISVLDSPTGMKWICRRRVRLWFRDYTLVTFGILYVS